MSKMSPHEVNTIVETYKRLERNCKKVHDATFGYAPSRVVEILEDTNRPEHSMFVRATKQCLEEKGHPFDYVFRKLHAVFYLLAFGGEQLDRAKKRYRLVLDKAKGEERSPEQARFLAFVKPEHGVLFKDS